MILLFLIFIFLVLRFTVTLFNFISNPKLPVSGRHYADLVSILIPVRNEAHAILHLLESIQLQDYVNYEVLVLDDSSTDSTFPVVEEFCRTRDKFSVVRSAPLPEGWVGKNFACHQLARAAHGQYLLFLDAGSVIRHGLINNAVHRMKYGRLSLLSLLPNQEMKTFGERLVVPLMHYLLLNLLPLRLVRLSGSSSFAAASGQFMLFESAGYRDHEWHSVVRSKAPEDVEIMRLVKGVGFHGETLLANGFILCRSYAGYREAVHGFSRNILAGFGNNVAALLLYLFLVIIGPLSVAFYLGLELLLFGIGLIVLTRIMISLAAGQNPWINLLLHPLQMFSLLIVAVIAIRKRFLRTMTWKGRKMTI